MILDGAMDYQLSWAGDYYVDCITATDIYPYISNILLFEQSIHLLHIFQNLINVVFILIFMQSPFLRNTNILPSVCFYASHSIIFTYYLPINKSRQWPMSKTGLHSIMQISSQSQPFATQIISSKMSLSYIQNPLAVLSTFWKIFSEHRFPWWNFQHDYYIQIDELEKLEFLKTGCTNRSANRSPSCLIWSAQYVTSYHFFL